MSNKYLSRRLDETSQAAQTFLEEYISKMNAPIVQLNQSLVQLDQTNDSASRKVHLDTLSQTLQQMDTTLRALLAKLERTRNS